MQPLSSAPRGLVVFIHCSLAMTHGYRGGPEEVVRAWRREAGVRSACQSHALQLQGGHQLSPTVTARPARVLRLHSKSTLVSSGSEALGWR